MTVMLLQRSATPQLTASQKTTSAETAAAASAASAAARTSSSGNEPPFLILLDIQENAELDRSVHHDYQNYNNPIGGSSNNNNNNSANNNNNNNNPGDKPDSKGISTIQRNSTCGSASIGGGGGGGGGPGGGAASQKPPALRGCDIAQQGSLAMRYYRLWIYACNIVLLGSAAGFAAAVSRTLLFTGDPRRYVVPGIPKAYEPTALYAYLALSVQLGVVQLLGCVAARRLSARLLNAYWYMLLALLFGDVFIGVAWVFRFEKMRAELRPDLKQRLQVDYREDPRFTEYWDQVQRDFFCCGVEGKDDFLAGRPPASCCAQPNATLFNSTATKINVPISISIISEVGNETETSFFVAPSVNVSVASALMMGPTSGDDRGDDRGDDGPSSPLNRESNSVVAEAPPPSPETATDSTTTTTTTTVAVVASTAVATDPNCPSGKYRPGCEAQIEFWMRKTADLLFVIGFCVIAFAKLCFLGILRYEIREMIQKIHLMREPPPPPVPFIQALGQAPGPQSQSQAQQTQATGGAGPHHHNHHHHHHHLSDAFNGSIGRRTTLPMVTAHAVLGGGTRSLLLQSDPDSSNRHPLLGGNLQHDTGGDSDTNSHCALILEESTPPPQHHSTASRNSSDSRSASQQQQQQQQSGASSNNYEMREFNRRLLLLSNGSQGSDRGPSRQSVATAPGGIAPEGAGASADSSSSTSRPRGRT